tara:strand:+ start:26 stop:598 length:573 start_codon:yes stop_codon:yes gene_type:complete
MTRQQQGTYKLFVKLNAKVERENYFNHQKYKIKSMFTLPVVSNELTKTQIKIIAEHSISELANNGRVIESADALAKMELLIKEIKGNKDYIELLREEVSKYGKSVNTASGTKIELAEVGTKYDYSNCGDGQLEDLNNQLQILELSIKERQTFLKALPLSGIEVLHMEGIIQKVYPPSKTSTSSVKTTISK